MQRGQCWTDRCRAGSPAEIILGPEPHAQAANLVHAHHVPAARAAHLLDDMKADGLPRATSLAEDAKTLSAKLS